MPLSIHTFLREQRDDIVREWEASIEAEPRVVSLGGALLRNAIPVLLDELADWMEQNLAPGTRRMHAAAITHASHRLDHGFQITQFIDEMGVLRTTIIRMLLAAETDEQDRGIAGMEDRVKELARLNAGLDHVIADIVKYFVDERERRIAEMMSLEIARVRESDQRKSDFLAVLSHELRNPLAPILNALEILTHAEANTEQSARATGVIQRQIQHLTRLVDDLLDMSRISHGKISLHRERFDLREVVRATCDDHRSLVEQRGLVLRLDIAAGPIWIDGDPTRIAQVTSNLLHNAAKFTPPGGLLNVAISVHAERASLHVRDNGVGMEPAMIEHLFEPFMQGAQDSSRPTGGLGLGLALIKGLVDLHGGSVSARSDGADLGSEFIVELPLVTPPPVAESRAPVAAPSRLVLLIDDSVDTGDSLAQLLELSGHRVRVARDGRSGIAIALEHQPDIIVCDIGLPDMKGYEVARELRKSGRLPATRFVALSGYAQPEDRQRSKEAGFDAHLVKPVAFHELNELLATARS